MIWEDRVIGGIALAGRERAHRRLAAMEARARDGRPSAVLYVGASGVGKSALLRSLRRTSTGTNLLLDGADRRLIKASGGTAGILALPVRHRLVPLAARHLLDRIWDDANCPPDAAAEAILACATTARRSPLIYLIDDLDLLDPAGRTTVIAVVERASTEPMVVVATSRAPVADWPAASVELGVLPDATVRRLLADAHVHPRVAEHLVPVIDGNPSAMHTLLSGLSPEALAGTDRLPSPLPLDPRLVASRASELDALDQDRRLEVIGEVLETAEELTLAATPPGAIRQAHRAAAHRSGGVAQLLHRASGADEPDDELARKLLEAADTQLARPDLATAIELLIAAGSVAADPTLTAACWYRAAIGSYLTGHSQRALDLVGTVHTVHEHDIPNAGLERIEALAGLHIDGIDVVIERLEAAVERAIAARDHGATRSLLLIAGVFSLYGCRVEDLAGFAARCAALPATDPVAAATTAVFTASAQLYASGEAAGVRALAPLLAGLADIPSPASPLPDLDLDPSRSQFFAALLLLTDEHWEPAKRLFHLVWTHDRAVGWTAAEGLDAAWYAELLWRTGAWNEALDVARGTLASTDPALGRSRLWVHAFLAGAERIRGDIGSAEYHRRAVEADDASPQRIPLVDVIMRSGTATGLLGEGDATAALEHLRPLANLTGPMHPGLVWWRADLVEALAATGQQTAAQDAATELETLAGTNPPLALRGRALRARAMATSGRRKLRLLDQGVQIHTAAGCPFELARSLLASSESRWAIGDDDSTAIDQAVRAQAIFDHLGATGFSRRADALLAGTASSTLVAGLSNREREIAELIASGATNKQVATQLGLSTRTVGSHLESVFRKLRIKTRTQLGSILRQR